MPFGQGPRSDSDDEDGGSRLRRGKAANGRFRKVYDEDDDGPPIMAENSRMQHKVVSAAYYGSVDILSAELRAGGDIDQQDNEGWRPLHAAVFTNGDDCVAYLIRVNAQLDLPGPNGMTALHYAARDDSHAAADMLLAARADTSLLDENGKTALELAAGNDRTLRLLEAYASGSAETIAAAKAAARAETEAAAEPASRDPVDTAASHPTAAKSEDLGNPLKATDAEPEDQHVSARVSFFGKSVDPDNPQNIFDIEDPPVA